MKGGKKTLTKLKDAKKKKKKNVRKAANVKCMTGSNNKKPSTPM